MTHVNVTLTDKSDRPESQTEEHMAMNALFRSLATPKELNSFETSSDRPEEGTMMNKSLQALTKAQGITR